MTYRHTKYACYLGYITQAIINNLAPLLFAAFQTQFHISLEQISLLISMNFGIQIIVDFFAAKFVDKIGCRPCVMAAHLFSVAGLVSLGVLPYALPCAYAGLLTAIILNAVGGGLTEVLISPIIEALPGDEKAAAMSLLHSFYCWGHVGVVILSTIYFTAAGIENWRFLPFLWAAVPLFNTFLFAAVPLKPLIEDAHEPMSLKKLLSVKVFWLLILMMICSGASEQAMSQWVSFFAEKGLHVSKTAGDLLGPCAFAACMGISRTFYGLKGSKIKLKRALALNSLLCAAAYITAVFSPWPLLALFGCALCGFSVGIMWPGVYSLSSVNYPLGGTAMFALLALAGDVGCCAGPALVGIVSEGAGTLNAGLLAAVVFPLVLIISIKTLSKSKRSKSPAH